MSPGDRQFAEIAIQLGLTTRAAVAGCLPLSDRDPSLPDVLLKRGILNQAAVDQVRAKQRTAERLEPATAATPPARRPMPANPATPAAATTSNAVPNPAPANNVAPANPAAQEAARGGTPYLHKVLAFAAQRGASDLHVHAGAPISARINGRLQVLKSPQLIAADDTERMIAQLLSDDQLATLKKDGQLDFAYSIADVGRFRVNAYRQHRGYDCVFRIIPKEVPSFEQLGLPKSLVKLLDFRTGIVLCTGPSGCGKSTTLAALLSHLIRTRKDHVLTMENPVEFLLPNEPCWVNQRQVITHTTSFARALRAALREDPDVIAITELRDRESIGLALSAAETGHLVVGTLHTGSAGQTIDRVINAFPGSEQEHVRSMLSESLRAVVSQRLVPRADGQGRVLALEVLLCTTAVANMIRDNKTVQLPSVMQTGTSLGMITLDNSLTDLMQQGIITKDEARRFALVKERFK